MIKVKDMMGKGLSAVRDLADFFKETVKNRKQKKASRTDEDKSLLPEMKTFDGIPLRDYCWLRDEIFRIQKKRIGDAERNFACKAVMIISFVLLIAGLLWIYIGIFPAALALFMMAGIVGEENLEKELQGDKFLMSFPEYGIWNSEEVKDFKYNFKDILDSFGCRSERVNGREFEKIFAMAGIDFKKPVYKIEQEKANFLLNIFYGLNEWETTDEMLYDMRKGEFSAEELLRRKNELCSFERNFVSKGKMKFRKTRKDRELERKEIDGKVYWTDDKGYIKIREEFSELTKFSERDIRGLLKGVYPSAETVTLMCGERFYEKGYVKLEGEGRRKHMMFFKQEWEKLDKEDVEEEEN